MQEDELIEALRRLRPQAPAAPAGEWKAIAQAALTPSPWRRWRAWVFASGAGLAFALGLWAVFLTPRVESLADDDAVLESYLSEAGQEMSAQRGAETPQAGLLALLDEGQKL